MMTDQEIESFIVINKANPQAIADMMVREDLNTFSVAQALKAANPANDVTPASVAAGFRDAGIDPVALNAAVTAGAYYDAPGDSIPIKPKPITPVSPITSVPPVAPIQITQANIFGTQGKVLEESDGEGGYRNLMPFQYSPPGYPPGTIGSAYQLGDQVAGYTDTQLAALIATYKKLGGEVIYDQQYGLIVYRGDVNIAQILVQRATDAYTGPGNSWILSFAAAAAAAIGMAYAGSAIAEAMGFAQSEAIAAGASELVTAESVSQAAATEVAKQAAKKAVETGTESWLTSTAGKAALTLATTTIGTAAKTAFGGGNVTIPARNILPPYIPQTQLPETTRIVGGVAVDNFGIPLPLQSPDNTGKLIALGLLAASIFGAS